MSELYVDRFDFSRITYLIDSTLKIQTKHGPAINETIQSLSSILLQIEKSFHPSTKLKEIERFSIELVDHLEKQSSVISSLFSNSIWGAYSYAVTAKQKLIDLRKKAEKREEDTVNSLLDQPVSDDSLIALGRLLVEKSSGSEKAKLHYIENTATLLATMKSSHIIEHVKILMQLDPDLSWMTTFLENKPDDEKIAKLQKALQKNGSLFDAIDQVVSGFYPHADKLTTVSFSLELYQKQPQDWDKEYDPALISRIVFLFAKHAERYSQKLDNGLTYLIRQKAELSWISPLLDTYQEQHETLELLLDKLDQLLPPDLKNSPVLARYRQIKPFHKELQLNAAEILMIARAIQQTFLTKSCVLPQYKKKRLFKLPRTVIREPSGDIQILMKRKTTYFVRDPNNFSSKVPSATLYVPENSSYRPIFGCQTVNKSELSDRESLKAMHDEAQFHKTISDTRGIWPLFSILEYSKSDGKKRISVTSPMGSSVTELCKPSAHFSLHDRLRVILDLAKGIEFLHIKKEVIHGDLKPDNALFDVAKAGWIDFGNRRSINEHQFSTSYGSVDFTAPELLGSKCELKDPTKLDIWAFGCMLYEIFSGKEPPWQEKVLSEIDAARPQPTEKHQKAFKTLVIEEMKKRLFLNAKKSPTTEDKIQSLYLSMLQLEPEDRPTITEVIKKLEQIMESLLI